MRQDNRHSPDQRVQRTQRQFADGLPSLRELFALMLEKMGPSHWWPAETRFEIMVGAILTQNTAWGNVSSSLQHLREAQALTPQALADMDVSDLQELIRPSGFQRNKARALQAMCEWYGRQCDYDPGKVAAWDDGELRAELLSIFGVGGETADDFMLYVFDRKVFIADTYARRLCDFIGFKVPPGYEAFRLQMMPQIAAEALSLEELQELHGLIDEFGKSHRSLESMKDSFMATLS